MSTSQEEIRQFIERFKSQEGFVMPQAFGIGIARSAPDGTMLDVWYPHSSLVNDATFVDLACLIYSCDGALQPLTGSVTYPLCQRFLYGIAQQALMLFGEQEERFREVSRVLGMSIDTAHAANHDRSLYPYYSYAPILTIVANVQEPLVDLYDVYLRLHMLSRGLLSPKTNLDKLKTYLPDVVWTSDGPILRRDVQERRFRFWQTRRQLEILSMDSFPKLIDYVIPQRVNLTDPHRYRLGTQFIPGLGPRIHEALQEP